jgi:hypothetical protein
MSRHRMIRDMDLGGSSYTESVLGLLLTDGTAARQAVDDDDYGGDDALSPEDESKLDKRANEPYANGWSVQMNHGLEVVLELVGPSSETGIPDSAIRDALWEYYFDINQTVEWVYGEPHDWHYDMFLTFVLEEKARLAAAQERKGQLLLY